MFIYIGIESRKCRGAYIIENWKKIIDWENTRSIQTGQKVMVEVRIITLNKGLSRSLLKFWWVSQT